MTMQTRPLRARPAAPAGGRRSWRRWLGAIVAGAALVVSASACSPTPANEGHGPLGLSNANRNAQAVIYITDNVGYFPSVVHARVGDNILVVNNSTGNHSVTAVDGSFDTGILAAGGEDYSFVVHKAGTFPFYDQLDPSMRGTLIVSG